MDILTEIATHAKERVRMAKEQCPLEIIRQKALSLPQGDFPFTKALAKPGLSFICECKKASPSKGIITKEFPYLEIARKYERAGADCISVLTEPKYFLGDGLYLQQIASQVHIPCLRKDFVVDEYMIYEAKVLGAEAVLLICSILDEKQLASYINLCNSLGLTALVEVHDQKEIVMVLQAGAAVIGVNNRNLRNFTVDVHNSCNLRKLVPKEILFVAESGIQNLEDIRKLREAGVDGVLIGEALMKADDIEAKLRGFKNEQG